MLGREIPTRDLPSPEVKDNGPVDNFNALPERPKQQAQDLEKVHQGSLTVESDGPIQDATNNTTPDQSSALADEASGEQHKHTYASIVCVQYICGHISIFSQICCFV